MRKQSLVHCHSLVDEVARFCIEDGLDLDLDAYRSAGTRPTAIHHSKGDHAEAVAALAGSITDALAEEREAEAVAAGAE